MSILSPPSNKAFKEINITKFNVFCRLLGLEVTSLEDVYWLEDSKARQAFQKDFSQWTTARQALPVSQQTLAGLKEELWSEVVKSSQHQDAWTWGKSQNYQILLFLYITTHYSIV